MRNQTWFVISCLVGGNLACAVDDSVVPMGTAGAAGGTSTGAAGKGAGGAATTAGAGGKGGAAGASSVAAGARGGAAGGAATGGAAGVGGSAGTAGAGGSMEAGVDATTEGGSADVMAPDAVVDAAPEAEACVPETDAALCARVQKDCGSFLGLDNCGVSRAVLACGRCVEDGAVCGSAGTLNVCPGTDPVNRAQGGTVLSTNPTSPPMGAVEGDLKVFDNDIRTKWYVRGNPTPSIAYDFGGTRAFAITSYTVTSANDAPDRDPLSWRLEGSNSQNLSTWTTLDTRTNQTFAARGQTNHYSFANTNGYIVYRFTVLANNGNTLNGGEFQVAEIQLFGNPASPGDASTDAASTDATMTDGGSGEGAGSDGAGE